MKKSLIAILVLLIILPSVISVEFVVKSEYKQSETLIGKISGAFVKPVLNQNVQFYRGHVKVPMKSDVAKFNDDFYIYAQLPNTKGNYSIVISNASYKNGVDVVKDLIIANFTISNATADFSVNPGFVITQNSFTIEIQNLRPSEIVVESKTNSETRSNTIKGGDIKKINFEVAEFTEPTLEKLEISSDETTYEIPISIFMNKTNSNVGDSFRVEPNELNFTMATKSNQTRVIYIYNLGNYPITKIELSLFGDLNDSLNLSAKKIFDIDGKSTERIELFFSSGKSPTTIKGKIKFESNDTSFFVPISVSFVQDFIPQNISEPVVTAKSCSELYGTFCNSTIEECEENKIVYATDGVCCTSSCKEIKTSSFSWKYFGWALIIAVVVFVLWFWIKKYKKVTPVQANPGF